MRKIIIGILAIVLILGGLVWIARPDSQANIQSSSAKISALLAEESGKYDFGTISMAKGVVKHQFKIKNTASEALTIDKMYTSCMCTTAELIAGEKKFGPYGMPGHSGIPRIGQALNPGEEAIVEVVFDPAAHGPAGVGQIQRTVIIENNAGNPLELQFTAIVAP